VKRRRGKAFATTTTITRGPGGGGRGGISLSPAEKKGEETGSLFPNGKMPDGGGLRRGRKDHLCSGAGARRKEEGQDRDGGFFGYTAFQEAAVGEGKKKRKREKKCFIPPLPLRRKKRGEELSRIPGTAAENFNELMP